MCGIFPTVGTNHQSNLKKQLMCRCRATKTEETLCTQHFEDENIEIAKRE